MMASLNDHSTDIKRKVSINCYCKTVLQKQNEILSRLSAIENHSKAQTVPRSYRPFIPPPPTHAPPVLKDYSFNDNSLHDSSLFLSARSRGFSPEHTFLHDIHKHQRRTNQPTLKMRTSMERVGVMYLLTPSHVFLFNRYSHQMSPRVT